jgi:DNA adenine methylase
MKTTAKLRPAVKRHGGKAYLARRIIARFPGHETYVEPFAGGLSVLLNKPPARTEVAGDLDAALVQFYVCLRDHTAELINRLRLIAYTAKSFARGNSGVRASFRVADDHDGAAHGRCRGDG